MPEDDEDIEISFDKVKNIFKKDTASSEVEKVEKQIDNTIEEEQIKIKELQVESLEREEEIEKLEEDKEKLQDVKDIIGDEEEKIEMLQEEEKEIKQEEKEEVKIIKKEMDKVQDIKEDLTIRESVKEEKDDEIEFNLSMITGLFKRSKKEKQVVIKGDDGIKDSVKEITGFFKKNKYVLPILLILIAILFSSFFRMYPSDLPAMDNSAKNNVYNFYQNQIRQQVDQNYPNLPDANKNAIVNRDFNEYLKNNKDTVEQQIKDNSALLKSQFKDANGDTYLLAIDPYYWFAEARNYVEFGEFGDENNEAGERVFSLRNGRQDKKLTVLNLNPLMGAWMYKILRIFDNDISVMRAVFLLPVLLIGLSIIPAFFIGRRLGGNIGGFFAAMIIALNAALLGRTPAGFSDTDPYNILFPLLIAWMFIGAMDAEGLKKKIGFSALGALFVGFYSLAWTGWWYVFDFIIITLVIYVVYQAVLSIKNKASEKGFLSNPNIKSSLIVGGSFFLSSVILVTLFRSFRSFMIIFRGPGNVVGLKDVAVTKIWPNVLTTVAEFNEVKLSAIVSQMGGSLLFWMGLMGIVLLLVNIKKMNNVNWAFLGFAGLYNMGVVALRESITSPITLIIVLGVPIAVGLLKILHFKEDIDVKYSLLLMIWFMGTLYGFTKGVRFAILMVPAFAISLGICVKAIYVFLSKLLSKDLHINKTISQSVTLLLLLLLLVAPIKTANSTALGEIPSMNDQWFNTLDAIRNDAEDGIITSWWDFGHWFYAMAGRRVTFDGGDQGERIHWVGKSLLTDDEEVSIGILRMLNCGQEDAPHVLESHLGDDTVRAIAILNNMF